MNQKRLFVFSAIFLLLAFVAGTLFYRNMQDKAAAELAERHRQILERGHGPSLGNPQAKVHIVEFLDPACETCRSFYPFVKNLMAAHPDKIRLTIRYAPFHHNSDKVVKILEATRRQGKYWQALESLFANQSGWVVQHTAQPEMVWRYLGGIGLDLDKVWGEANDPEISRLVLQDVEDARTLKVTKTPEFFVNGRPLPRFGYEELRSLVEDELENAYR